MPERFVIVGANLAGGTAAATLREQGFGGEVVLIGEEPQLPYERPPLSKEYLRGEKPFEDALLRPTDFWADHDIETLLGARVVRVHAAELSVELAGGDRLSCDKLLIATGCRNRRPPVPGLDLEGVHDLRTAWDADRIRSEIAAGRKAVVVGMGFIGAEVAASLRRSGVEVAAIEPLETPLHSALGGTIGRVFEAIHRDEGVDLVLGDAAAAFEGAGRVERVVTREGRSIECDFAVFGVGVEPVTDLVAEAGVEVDNGIVVDELCRTTIPGIFAAGDVTNHYHPLAGRTVRVEHWQNALKQGAAAALSMIGRPQPYGDVHWFWSDQYDHNLQYAGFLAGWDEMIVRGSIEERNFVAFYLKGGKLQAAVGLNRGREVRRSMPLIRAGSQVSVEKLRDEDVDLRKVVG